MQNTNVETLSTVKSPKIEESRDQLARILRNPEFVRSPKSSKFLKYVVEETIAGRQTYLKAYTIALAVFGKDQAFDPQTDPIVRVQAVRLRKLLEQYYLYEGKNDQVIINLFKGSYIPKIYYSDEHEVDLNIPAEQIETVIPSIAVMPFKFLGDDDSQEFFADGITEEIIVKLSHFKEILVIARHTTHQYKEKIIDPKVIGNELDVRFILVGSIRKAGSHIRITVELIETRNSAAIWSQSYDKELSVENLITIQDEIANTVSATIAQPYGIILGKDLRNLSRSSTKNLTAYEYVLRYYQFLSTFSLEDYEWAREGAEKAIKIDPSYSDAWAALAILTADEYQMAYRNAGQNYEVVNQGFEMAQTAVKTGPDNAFAHYSLFYLNVVKHDIEAFKNAAQRALELNPRNAFIHGEYGVQLSWTGEWEKAFDHIEHAMTLNPSHPDFYHLPYIAYYYCNNDIENAAREMKKVNLPEMFWTHFFQAVVHHELGDKTEASNAVDRLNGLYPGFDQVAQSELEKWIHEKEIASKLLDGYKQACRH